MNKRKNYKHVSRRDWCLAQWLILSTSVVRTWGRIPLGQFLVAELVNIQYPVKSFPPYLGGRRGWVPSDSLRKFLQKVNLYNLFKLFFKRVTQFGFIYRAADMRTRKRGQ